MTIIINKPKLYTLTEVIEMDKETLINYCRDLHFEILRLRKLVKS